jgi:hypothetical protein
LAVPRFVNPQVGHFRKDTTTHIPGKAVQIKNSKHTTGISSAAQAEEILTNGFQGGNIEM